MKKSFDLDGLDPGSQQRIREATHRIRELIHESLDRRVQIGQELLAVKGLLLHGRFGLWLDAEFGWSDRTARRYMSVAQCFGKTDSVSDLPIDATAAYLLSQSASPPEAREKAVARAQRGERITLAVAKEILGSFGSSARAPAPGAASLATKDRLLEQLANITLRVRKRWPVDELDEVVEYLETLARQLRSELRQSKKAARSS